MPQKRYLKSDFWHFLNKILVPHSATRLAAPVTLTPHRVEYGVIHPPTPSSSPVTVLYCTVMYCTVLYCTKSPPEELEVGGHRPPYLLVSQYYTKFAKKYQKNKQFAKNLKKNSKINQNCPQKTAKNLQYCPKLAKIATIEQPKLSNIG